LFKNICKLIGQDVSADTFSPFTKKTVARIAELSEFNASKILKMAYEVLERAVDQNVAEIDVDFVLSTDEANQLAEQRQVSGIFHSYERSHEEI